MVIQVQLSGSFCFGIPAPAKLCISAHLKIRIALNFVSNMDHQIFLVHILRMTIYALKQRNIYMHRLYP